MQPANGHSATFPVDDLQHQRPGFGGSSIGSLSAPYTAISVQYVQLVGVSNAQLVGNTTVYDALVSGIFGSLLRS